MPIQLAQSKAAAMLPAEQDIDLGMPVLKLPGVDFITRMQLMSAIITAIGLAPRKTEVGLLGPCGRLSDETITLAVNEYIGSHGNPPFRILVWCRRDREARFLCIETISAPDSSTEAPLPLPFADSTTRSKFVSTIAAAIRVAPKTTVVDLGDYFHDPQPSREKIAQVVGGYISALQTPARHIALRCERVGNKQTLVITAVARDNAAAGGDGSDE